MAVRSEPDEFRVVLRGKQRGKKCLKLLIWSGNIGGKITQGLVLCSVRGERSFLLLVCHKRAWSWCFICDAHVCEACVSADGAAARQDAWAPALFSFESPHTKHEDLHSRCWLVCFLPVFTSLLRFNTLSTPTTTTHKHTHTSTYTHCPPYQKQPFVSDNLYFLRAWISTFCSRGDGFFSPSSHMQEKPHPHNFGPAQ